MGINLVKGQNIDLSKNENGSTNDLTKLTIGLGWDIRKSGGFFGMGGSSNSNYDLDACALLLNKDGKLTSNDDIVSFSNPRHKSGHIWSNGDNLTGDGDGDDEQITVLLDKVDAKYERIVFYATIYQGQSRGQEFSMVENAFIRAVDNKNNEICKYKMSGDSTLKNKRSFIFGEAYRHNGAWKFRALGEAKDTDSLTMVAEAYR